VVDAVLNTDKKDKPGVAFDNLTAREREILKLIAEGNTNKKIADHLCISLKTVEKHRSNLMKKLDLRNTAALTAYAIEKKMVDF
jgi:RNA polymerase sigma factor (sigma-70 family)